MTFSNNSVNISSEDENVSYAVNGSVGYPPGGTTTIGAKPNNSSGGKNVGQTTMTLLDVSMDTVYAGRDFDIYLWPTNQQGHLTLKTSDGVIYDNDVTGPTVTFTGPYNVSTITSIWTIADGRATDDAPVLQPANYWDLGISGPEYVAVGITNSYTAVVTVTGDGLPDPMDGTYNWSITGSTMTFADGIHTGETVSVIASTNNAGINTLSLTFTPNEQGLDPKSTNKTVTVVKVDSIDICKTAIGVWDSLPWQQVIRDGDDFKVKIGITPNINSLSTFINIFSPKVDIRTFMIDGNGNETTMITKNVNITLSNSSLINNNEIRLTIPANDVRSYGLVSKTEDGSGEFSSIDSADTTTGTSNRNDSDAFDSNSSGTQRELARGGGNINTTPPEAVAHGTFFQAAGSVCIDVKIMNKSSEKRLIQEQADEFYYSGHGTHSTASLQFGGPSIVTGYWDDIDIFIIAGCSVLDINDYNNNFTGNDHDASPGKKWEPTGPDLFLGYNYKAPSDEQNSDVIITSWQNNRATMSDVDAWRSANDNSNGRNACAIETGTKYYYFKKGGIYPFNTYTWTIVLKSNW